MNLKKIAVIGTVGLPAKYGGFETLTEYLTKNLSQSYDITVFCSGKNYDEKLSTYNGATLKYIDLNANGIQSIPYDIISIFKSLRDADTLLILGVSGCIVLPIIRLFSKKRIVVNIDGLEWKREKWNKYAKAFLKFSENMAVKYADVVISDNKVIQDYVFSEYGKASELIAYGADHVQKLPLSNDILKKYPFLNKKYAFTVCRIEPENNLHIIIEAMAQQDKLPLVIIGNWENSSYGKELRAKYLHQQHIHFIDPIYDQKILNEIRSNCAVYLHGHSAGGTNPSLVEAMHLNLPIFAYSVSYNKETTGHNADYFTSSEDLTKLIETIDEDRLNINAEKMYEIASSQYIWSAIAQKYAEFF
jgi:glycosyltransferase involved in cell wall biosynthesis